MRESGNRWGQRGDLRLIVAAALLVGVLGCRETPDPGMHTSDPKGDWEIHIRLKEPLPEIGPGKDVWFRNVRLVLFTNEGALASLGKETDRPPCYDPTGKAEECVRVPWKDMKLIEWQDDGRLITTLRQNGYRLSMFSSEPLAEPRIMRVRFERAVPVAGGYKVERTTKDRTFDLTKVASVEFQPG